MKSEVYRAKETTIEELSVVKLTRTIEDPTIGTIPECTMGAVVSVYGDGDAYEVEFVSPHAISLTLTRWDIEVVPQGER